MKISVLLPYKENYSSEYPGAVSLFVSSMVRISKFKKKIKVFGSTNYKKYLTKNYVNISLNKSVFSSQTKQYINNFIKIQNNEVDLIEIHNRPIMLDRLVKNINSKFILYFHNDPKTMKGAKTSKERYFLLNQADKIIFISNWVKQKFFEDLDIIDHNKTEIIYHSIDPIKKISKKKNNFAKF